MSDLIQKDNIRKLSYFLLPLLLLLLVFSSCSKKETVVRLDKFKAGTLAPDIEGVDVDGNPIKLSDLRGTPVLLSFYATWCAPCIKELPDLIELHNIGISLDDKNDRTSIKVLMVNTDSSNNLPEVKMLRDKYKMNMPIVLDPEMITVAKYEVGGFPETFLLDKEGRFLQILDPEQKEKTTRIISTRNWLSEDMKRSLINSINANESEVNS